MKYFFVREQHQGWKEESTGKGYMNALWAVGYVLIFVALQFFAQTVMIFVEGVMKGEMPTQLSTVGIMVALVIFSLGAIALFTLLRWTSVSRKYIMSRPWGVIFWSILAALGAIIPSMFVQEQMPEWPEALQKIVDQTEKVAAELMRTPGGYAILALLAPVAEEVVFRGAALGTLLKWKPQHRWLMIVLSALLFALAHMNPAQLLHPFAIGLLLGWMYARTGSIVPGIVYHWANNTAAYLLFQAYPNPHITLVDIFGGLQSRVLMAVVFSLLILIPAIYQLHIRMKRV